MVRDCNLSDSDRYIPDRQYRHKYRRPQIERYGDALQTSQKRSPVSHLEEDQSRDITYGWRTGGFAEPGHEELTSWLFPPVGRFDFERSSKHSEGLSGQYRLR
jgi:hypothetical protein